MTSPQTTTAEVAATMAATGIYDDNPPNLTAEIHPATEINAPTALQQETGPATMSADENKEIELIAEDGGEEVVHQGSMRPEDVATPAPNHDGLPRFEDNNPGQQVGQEQNAQDLVRPEDAAIPQLNHDSLQAEFGFPDQAGLDALMAMGQIGYDPNLALGQTAPLGMPMLPIPNQDGGWANQEDANRPEDRLVGYAKLCFEDGEFYMNTHSIKLGRDPIAHKTAQRREKEEERLKREADERTRKGDSSAPRTPTQIKREHHIPYSISVYSEKSGILRDGNDSDGETRARRRQRRKASKKSKSTGSSHDISRRNSLAQPVPKTHIYEPQYPDRIKEEHAAPVDPASLRPDPNECPLIPLHPPGNAPASAYKSISREHVKIAYNFNKAIFEMHIYGRNGAFVDEVYHPMNSVVELKSGNMLQIGQVPLEFVLPDGLIADAAEGYSTGGKEMSYDFEEVKRDGVPEDTSPELVSDDAEGIENEDEDGEEIDEAGEELGEEGYEDEEGAEMSDQDESGLVERDEEEEVGEDGQAPQPQSNAPSGKKRGPGRPPKDGIMSQREKQLAKKAAQENQKAQKSVSQPTSAPLNGKEKKPVGRPRKHERPDPAEPEKPKRKYTKRKPKEPKEGDGKQEGSDGEDQTKEKKEKKAKPPRSPSPFFDESTLAPEELQKPSANYVTLIYEALSNSKEGKLGLPQIYRAIQRKYPYFVLKVGTLGWQSSVRHNLSQHHAFKKCERDGKGWLWGIEPGVSIEKEKKRRTPPPPQMGGHMHHQQIYQAGQQPYMGPPGQHPYPQQQMMGHPGYLPHQMMHAVPRPGQPQQFMGPPPPHMNGHPPPHNTQPPANPIGPGFAAALAPQLAGNSTYSSPYAPKPAAQTAAPLTEQRLPGEQQHSAQGPPPQIAPQAGSQGPHQTQLPQSNQSQGQQQPQSQPPQSHPPQSQPYQGPQPSVAPQQPPPRPPNTVPELPQHSQQIVASVDSFKKIMLGPMKDKHPQGEEILNSAVNQVLGYTHQSSIPGNSFEEGIINALRGMLEKMPGFKIAPANSALAAASQTNGQPQPATNQGETQASNATTPQPPKSTGSDRPPPTVMRPTFTGQGHSRPSIARPQMGTPGMKRTNSGSPAQQGGESGQLAGQKRTLEDADDNREVKRLNGSSTPQTPQAPQVKV